MEFPNGLEYWTADEVAECLGYWKHLEDNEGNTLYQKLWRFLDKADNPTPLGGDGSDGTVEYPCGRMSLDNDDKVPHWWEQLTETEQVAIVAAYCDHMDIKWRPFSV